MLNIFKAAGTVTTAALLATSGSTQTAREIRGLSPYEQPDSEPPPRLIVDPPLPGPLTQGVFQAQYRVENVYIVPVFGEAATKVKPRLGHLHIIVDDLPWWWADASNTNTVDLAGLPPGPHKVKIQLVDPNHNVVKGQVKTLHFTIPPYKQVHNHGE